jgi:hypothetical protein
VSGAALIENNTLKVALEEHLSDCWKACLKKSTLAYSLSLTMTKGKSYITLKLSFNFIELFSTSLFVVQTKAKAFVID